MNHLTPQQQAALMAPLNAARVASRRQGSASLSYLEAWDVKAALIRVFGFGGFSAEVIQSAIVDQREVPKSNGNGTNWKISAQATVRLYIKALDAVYTETAIGGSSQPDITEAMDMALKTAESDALKRAAIYLGTQFGLSLYNNGSTSDVVRVVLAPGQEWTAQGPARSDVEQPNREATAPDAQNPAGNESATPEATQPPSDLSEAVAEATGVSQDPDELAKAEAFVANALNAKRAEQ